MTSEKMVLFGIKDKAFPDSTIFAYAGDYYVERRTGNDFDGSIYGLVATGDSGR